MSSKRARKREREMVQLATDTIKKLAAEGSLDPKRNPNVTIKVSKPRKNKPAKVKTIKQTKGKR